MFNPVEIDRCRPIIEGFKNILLEEDYYKCIEYIKQQRELDNIFNAHFDKSKKPREIIRMMKDRYRANPEHYVLFNILMLYRDQYCYQPWTELMEVFADNSPLHSYKCLFIYHNLRKRHLAHPGGEELKLDLFRKWEATKDLCGRNNLWVEAFGAALQQSSISDEYFINYITFVDYNLDKLMNHPSIQHVKKLEVIEAVKEFLKDNIQNNKFSNWIQAILYETDGDLDSSVDCRVKDYRKHKNPMVIVRKLYSIKEFDRLEAFLNKELESDPENKEIGDSLKRLEILKIVPQLEYEELIKMVEEAVFKGTEVPSGEKLSELCIAFNKHGKRKPGVEIFRLFKQLFPLDHEVCKYYAMLLEADGQIEEAFRNYDLILMSGFDDKRTIADIRIVVIAALAHDRYEYANRVYARLNDMEDIRKEIDELHKSGNRYGMKSIHKLYIQVNKELKLMMDLYAKGQEDKWSRLLKKDFKSICTKVVDYDCIGIVDQMFTEEYSAYMDFEEIKDIVKVTATYSKKIFPLKLHMMRRYLECLEAGDIQCENMLAVVESLYEGLSVALKYATDNTDTGVFKFKEIIDKLKSYDDVQTTLIACIDMLHDNTEPEIKRFVLLLMTGLFSCSRSIKSIFGSSYDKKESKKLILEFCRIYIEELNKGTYFHVKLGFDLLDCFYIEEAKQYFEFAMNNMAEDEKGAATSQLMYYVCDLLIKIDKGLDIDPADYEKKSFFTKAVLSLVKNAMYENHVSKYLSNRQDKNSEIIIMFNAFNSALKQDYHKAQEVLKGLRHNKELYEACEIQISSLLVKNNEYISEEEDLVEEETAVTVEESDEAALISAFLVLLDHVHDIENFMEELLDFVPLLAESVSQCQLIENDLEDQYKVWTSVIDRYVGTVEALSMSELSNRSDACLKASAAARIMGRHSEFLKYMAEYCEVELERLTRGQKIYSYQVALAYEAHLIWYARYKYYRKHNLNISKSDKKLGYYHIVFFKAFTLIDDFSILHENMTYVKRITLLFSRIGYKFLNVYQKEYKVGKEGILNHFNSFSAAIERYVDTENGEDKRIYMDVAIDLVKKMEETAEDQFYQKDKYDINAFTNSLLFLCNEEITKLENKPVIKVAFLNQEDIHTIAMDGKFQSSFHFLISNDGKADAHDFSCSFKILRKGKMLSIPYTQENLILKEDEKLPVGFKYIFDEEGEYEVEIETWHSDGIFKNFSYSIDVRDQGFVFERIKENTYPTAPIDDESKFFGRKAIVQRIKDRLYDDSDRTTFLIYGLRRVGKTSLLNHIENTMKDRFYPIQCDCQNVFDANNTGQLIYQLFVENVVYGLADDYDIDIDMPSEEDFEKSPLRQLKRFFMIVEKSIGDKSLLLLVDEFDEVVKKVEDEVYSHELFDFIRTKMQHSNKTRFIIAGGEYLLNIMKNKALKISDTAKPLEVGFLEPDEAREMMVKPLSGKGIQCLPQTLERILMITSGHPYFLTAIGNGLVELLNNEKERYVIYPDDVEFVSDKLIDMTQSNMYKHFWDSLNTNYKKLIVAIIGEQLESSGDYIDIDRLYDRIKEVRDGGSLSSDLYKDKVRAIINELISGRILSIENKDRLTVRISVEQLRRWTRRWKNVDSVLYEIQGGIESDE